MSYFLARKRALRWVIRVIDAETASRLWQCHFEPAQCRKAGPVGLIGLKIVKIEQIVPIPPGW
ncbi:hypothetical protein DTL42_24990 [Bremerella cremea]|uniref:Uncharacterized protein n=1 Tax=Bremerella cremea TaxID=1031537 RepID=A0A368KLD0_9BACT|nr:hypothetical protein DTL42_24990 [Bremerella cremea]